MNRALLLALLACAWAGMAQAFVLTSVSYEDDQHSFKWTFKISFGQPTPLGAVTPVDPDGEMDWTMSATYDDIEGDGKFNDIRIEGKHLDGPHKLDVDPGKVFKFTFNDIIDPTPVINPEPDLPQKVGTETPDHLHTPNNHKDVVDLFLTELNKQGGNYTDGTFVLQGVHVPEPISAALLLTGAAGLMLWRRWPMARARAS
jgi:hypothetical protein